MNREFNMEEMLGIKNQDKEKANKGKTISARLNENDTKLLNEVLEYYGNMSVASFFRMTIKQEAKKLGLDK